MPYWRTELTNVRAFHAIMFQDQPTVIFTEVTVRTPRVVWRLPNGTWFDSGQVGFGYFGTSNYPCSLTILLNRLYLFCHTGSNQKMVYASHSGNISDTWLIHTQFNIVNAGLFNSKIQK